MGKIKFYECIIERLKMLIPCFLFGHAWFYEPMAGDIPDSNGKYRFGNCCRCGVPDPDFQEVEGE